MRWDVWGRTTKGVEGVTWNGVLEAVGSVGWPGEVAEWRTRNEVPHCGPEDRILRVCAERPQRAVSTRSSARLTIDD